MTKNTPSAGKGPRRDPDKEQFWRRALKEQAAGGQDVRAFCAVHGLSEPSFYSWRRTLGRRDRTATMRPARRETERPTFVEMRPQQPLAPAAPAEAPLEVLAGTRRLLIRGGCDLALLREVLAALGA